jgi:hypothetical protein
MTDSLLYSETAEHLANLDVCASRDLRRAYLALVLAAERAGYHTQPRPKGDIRELQIRDAENSQHFAVLVNRDGLLFTLRQPAFRNDPDLADKARARYGEQMLAETGSQSEVRIPIRSERDADDIAEWLFTREYAARRSA